jgi:hypothetical protein
MPRIAEMEGVRGSDTGCPVLLYRSDETGRVVVRCFNEGGFSGTDLDLQDLLEWLGRNEWVGPLLDARADDAPRTGPRKPFAPPQQPDTLTVP